MSHWILTCECDIKLLIQNIVSFLLTYFQLSKQENNKICGKLYKKKQCCGSGSESGHLGHMDLDPGKYRIWIRILYSLKTFIIQMFMLHTIV